MADGYFPSHSMLRFVQSHRAVGHTYGQRALIIGATHPVPYVGTSDRTWAKEHPFERLARTAKAFEVVYFGSKRQADQMLAAVHSLHEKVKGELRQDEGTFPAGTRYDAFDPELMFWTMAMLADSSRACFEALVRPLSIGEREELWADWVRFGELFGMPKSAAPARADDFDDWMGGWIRGGRMHLTEEARVVGRAIARDMPVPLMLRPGMTATNLVVQGLLPPEVRDLYGLRWTPVHDVAFRSATAAVRRSQRVMPERIRFGDNRELHDLVIRTERDRIARGRLTMKLPEAS